VGLRLSNGLKSVLRGFDVLLKRCGILLVGLSCLLHDFKSIAGAA
jgi:hypothetical protein